MKLNFFDTIYGQAMRIWSALKITNAKSLFAIAMVLTNATDLLNQKQLIFASKKIDKSFNLDFTCWFA